MIDEIFDRGYQSGRPGLNAGIDRALARLAKGTGGVFRSVNRIQFAAPWADRRKPGRA